MPVKGNQETLRASIRSLFRDANEPSAPPGENFGSQKVQVLGDKISWLRRLNCQTATSHETHHGRHEWRQLTVLEVPSEAAVEHWPYARQVWRVDRRRTDQKSGQTTQETIYGITSLSRPQASAKQMLIWVRGHWQIENGTHWVRDVTMGEDACLVRTGRIPQILAALRNAVRAIIRIDGEDNVAKAQRRYAAQPRKVLQLINRQGEN